MATPAYSASMSLNVAPTSASAAWAACRASVRPVPSGCLPTGTQPVPATKTSGTGEPPACGAGRVLGAGDFIGGADNGGVIVKQRLYADTFGKIDLAKARPGEPCPRVQGALAGQLDRFRFAQRPVGGKRAWRKIDLAGQCVPAADKAERICSETFHRAHFILWFRIMREGKDRNL